MDQWEDNQKQKSHAEEKMALDKLFSDIARYRDGQNFYELIQFISNFPYIAPYNAFLIYIQRPGCRYVTTEEKWRKLYNRKIKPEARPLIILKSFGPFDYVFDISDTDEDENGSSIPEEILNPFKTKGVISKIKYNRIINNLDNYGIKFVESNFWSQHAGEIKLIDSFNLNIIRSKNIYNVTFNYCMEINKNYSKTEKFATIVHELCHLFCGHLGSPNEKLWCSRKSLDENSEEFEAETIVWLVCERLDIENPSVKYLSNYLNENRTIPSISIETVLKSINKIEQMIYNNLQLSKYLSRKIEV